MGLRDSEGMACPQCGQDQHIFIQCEPAWSKLLALDDDDSEWEDVGGHEYADDNAAECPDCPWSGKVRDLYLRGDEGKPGTAGPKDDETVDV